MRVSIRQGMNSTGEDRVERLRSKLVWSLLAVFAIIFGLAGPGSAHVRATAQKAAARDLTVNKTYGPRDAPIKIEEFSDFQCPACRELYLQTLRPLIDEFVSSGKVYLVHHDFPLPMHKYSRQAARYANAAGAIGKFAGVEAALFDKQPEWEASGNVTGAVASALTPEEMKRVEEIIRSGRVDPIIERDVALGHLWGVQQTPTMFVEINGQRNRIVGVVNYTILRTYLNELLARK
jgi:protein-disulfide isomerase